MITYQSLLKSFKRDCVSVKMSKSPEVVVSLTLAIHDEAQKATPSSKV